MKLSVHRAAFALVLGKVLRAPLWLLISALLARLLGPDGVGAWSMVLAAGMFLNQLFVHWTQVITQRFGRSEWVADSGLNRTYSNRAPLLIIAFFCAIFLVLYDPLGWLESFFGVDGDARFAVIGAWLAVWLLAETQALQQTQERYLAMAWMPIVVDCAYLSFLLLALFIMPAYFKEEATSFSLVWVFVLLAVLWSVCWLREWQRLAIRLKYSFVDRAVIRQMVFFALPLVPAALVGYLAEWIDYFLLRYFMGEVSVGFFHPAFQYVVVVLGVPSALVAILLPRLVDAVDSADAHFASELMHVRMCQYVYGWGCLTLILSACLPWFLSKLLGSDFSVSVELVQIMLCILPGAIVQHICMALSMVQGRLAFSTIFLFAVKLAVNAIASILLIVELGVAGAAIGMVVGYFVLHWLLLIDQLRVFKISIFSGLTVSLLVCQLIALLMVFVDGLLWRMCFAMLAVVIVVLLVRLRRIFSREEVGSWCASLGPLAPLIVFVISRK